jgi:alkylation response protein AidB-like acyl-CoA dehydrogenase
MDANFTDEQELFRRTLVRAFRAGEGRSGFGGDDRRLAEQLVVLGGTELPGEVERGILFEEAGRACSGLPVVTSWGIALAVLDALDPDGDLRAATVAGQAVPILALGSLVPDGGRATHLLVPAGDELGVVTRPDFEVVELDSFDLGRPLARVRHATPPAAIGPLDGCRAVVHGRALLAVAHELTGIAGACLAVAVDHAASRTQFDRPIGANQAISHQCVDMYIAVESARSHAYAAAEAVDAATAGSAGSAGVSGGSGVSGGAGVPGRDTELAVRQAHAVAAEAAVFCAQRALQVLGGLGFTWEHPVHRYLRRAQSSAHLVASARASRARIATLIGLGPEPAPAGLGWG